MADLGDFSARAKDGRLTIGGRVGSGDFKVTLPGRPAAAARLSLRSTRRALILTTDTYDDARLQKVAPSPTGVSGLARVLRDPKMGNFEAVAVVRNTSAASAADEIEGFLAEGSEDEALLVYVHGVAVQADDGRLFLATTDTSLTSPGTASIETVWLEQRLRPEERKREVLILDCRYTARFGRAGGPRPGDEVLLDRWFPPSSGRAVFTASPVLEAPPRTNTALDTGRELIGPVITGLRGKADGDADGVVTAEELFAHVCGAVAERAPTEIPVVVDPGPARRVAVAHGARAVENEIGIKSPATRKSEEHAADAGPDASSAGEAGGPTWPPANEAAPPPSGIDQPSGSRGLGRLRSTGPWRRTAGWLPWALGATVAAVAVSVPLAVGTGGSGDRSVPVVTSPTTTPVVVSPPAPTSPPTTSGPAPRATTPPPGPRPTAPPPAPTTLPPPVPPPPAPSPFQRPRLSLSKSSGPPGTELTVTGSGYAPGELVRIRFHTETLEFTTADANGAFSNVAVEIPATWRFTGQFDIIATGEDSIRSTSRPFEVTAA